LFVCRHRSAGFYRCGCGSGRRLSKTAFQKHIPQMEQSIANVPTTRAMLASLATAAVAVEQQASPFTSSLACGAVSEQPAAWTITVRTMTGAAIAVPCRAAALTTITDIKRTLSAQNRHWAPERQSLMRAFGTTGGVDAKTSDSDAEPVPGSASMPVTIPSESASNVGSSATASRPVQFDHSPLADDRTLADCGLGDGCALELLVQVRAAIPRIISVFLYVSVSASILVADISERYIAQNS
jgi:hypothetical protein